MQRYFHIVGHHQVAITRQQSRENCAIVRHYFHLRLVKLRPYEPLVGPARVHQHPHCGLVGQRERGVTFAVRAAGDEGLAALVVGRSEGRRREAVWCHANAPQCHVELPGEQVGQQGAPRGAYVANFAAFKAITRERVRQTLGKDDIGSFERAIGLLKAERRVVARDTYAQRTRGTNAL